MLAGWPVFGDLRRLSARDDCSSLSAMVMRAWPSSRFCDLPARSRESYKNIPMGTFVLLARLPNEMIHVAWRTKRDEVDVMLLVEAKQFFELI